MNDFIPDVVGPGEPDICNIKVIIPDVEHGSGIGIMDQIGPAQIVAALNQINNNLVHYSGGMFGGIKFYRGTVNDCYSNDFSVFYSIRRPFYIGWGDSELQPTFWMNIKDFEFRTMFRDTAKQFFTTQSLYEVNEEAVLLRTSLQTRQDIDALPVDEAVGDVLRSETAMFGVAQRFAKSDDYTVFDVFHPYNLPSVFLPNRFVGGQPVIDHHDMMLPIAMSAFYEDGSSASVPVVMTGGVYMDADTTQD